MRVKIIISILVFLYIQTFAICPEMLVEDRIRRNFEVLFKRQRTVQKNLERALILVKKNYPRKYN